MPLSDSQENDKEKRLPGWEREEASDDNLSEEVKEHLHDYEVPEEPEEEQEEESK